MDKIIKYFCILILSITSLVAFEYPDISGWKRTDSVTTYTPNNLWNYINGAADMYLDYGFVKLKTANFTKDTNKITVDVYNMENKLNAFGIYTSEANDKYKTLGIGTESIIYPPREATMLKDKYYIIIKSVKGQITNKNGKSLLKTIAQDLKGSTNFPQILNKLPSKNKISGSENFIKKDYLGLNNFSNCILAKYSQDTLNYQIFYFVKSNSKNKVWAKFEKNWKNINYQKNDIKLKEIPYQGLVGLIQTQEGIFGVTDLKNKKHVLKILDSIAREQ